MRTFSLLCLIFLVQSAFPQFDASNLGFRLTGGSDWTFGICHDGLVQAAAGFSTGFLDGSSGAYLQAGKKFPFSGEDFWVAPKARLVYHQWRADSIIESQSCQTQFLLEGGWYPISFQDWLLIHAGLTFGKDWLNPGPPKVGVTFGASIIFGRIE